MGEQRPPEVGRGSFLAPFDSLPDAFLKAWRQLRIRFPGAEQLAQILVSACCVTFFHTQISAAERAAEVNMPSVGVCREFTLTERFGWVVGAHRVASGVLVRP